MKTIIALIVFLIFLFIPISSVLAVTVNINSFPSVISSDSFTITASISGATAGTNYLKLDIFKDTTSNYFGETFNGLDWYNGSTYSQYLPINILSSTVWTGSVQGRIGTPNSTDYDGQGTYKIRLRRYTSGGGYTSAEANGSSVTVSINLPTPTLSPTNSPTPAPTNTPTLTSSPTLILTKTPTPSSKPSLTITPFDSVLGKATKSALPTKKKEDVKIESLSFTPNNLIAKITIFLGVVFLLACAIVIAYPYVQSFRKDKFND